MKWNTIYLSCMCEYKIELKSLETKTKCDEFEKKKCKLTSNIKFNGNKVYANIWYASVNIG